MARPCRRAAGTALAADPGLALELWWLGYAIAQGGYFRGGDYLKGGSRVLSDLWVKRIRDI